MKINYFVALALSTLVSVQMSAVFAKSAAPPASPTATTPKPSANPAPIAQSTPPDSAQQRLQELEQLNQIQEVVNQKVDEKFGLTTSLLNILLLLLILFPIAGLLLLWYYRRNLTEQIKQDVHKEIVPELKAELTKSLGSALSRSPKGEVAPTANPNLSGENVAQLKELITMAMATQNVMSEARTTIEDSLNTQAKASELLKEVFEHYGNNEQAAAYSTPEPEPYIAPEPEVDRYDPPAPKPAPSDLPQWGSVSVRTYETEPRNYEPVQTVSSPVEDEPVIQPDVMPPIPEYQPPQRPQHHAYSKHGDDLFLEGRYDDALSSYDQAIQRDPEDYESWCGKGVVLTKMSHFDEAIGAFNQSLRINSDYADAWYEKSRCYALRGNIESAIENLKQSINLNPGKRQQAKTDSAFGELRSMEWFDELMR